MKGWVREMKRVKPWSMSRSIPGPGGQAPSPGRRLLPPLFLLLSALGASVVSLPTARAQSERRSEFVPTFSTNARVKQQLERLSRLATQKSWDEWLAGYQQLVDDPRDLIVP
ncbi:MAG TPA: hypothetical protein VK689_13960, partial [Armatimonadota bacterium]|nr:hypothetical protein [Armatimonadota bacterium]